MAQSTIDIEVKGLQELQRKMEQMVEDLHGAPILQAMRDSTLMVQRDGKIFAPVDTGRLRASITPEVVTSGEELRGIVGSNVEYAPYQEFGTVRGIKPKLYLTRAFQKNEDAIRNRFDRAIEVIVNK